MPEKLAEEQGIAFSFGLQKVRKIRIDRRVRSLEFEVLFDVVPIQKPQGNLDADTAAEKIGAHLQKRVICDSHIHQAIANDNQRVSRFQPCGEERQQIDRCVVRELKIVNHDNQWVQSGNLSAEVQQFSFHLWGGAGPGMHY